MPSTDEIRSRICIESTSPTYPVAEFADWLERRHYAETLEQLQEIQRELNADEYAWRQAAEHGKVTTERELAARWCAYCTQLRIYYQRVLEGHESKPAGRGKLCRWLMLTLTSGSRTRRRCR